MTMLTDYDYEKFHGKKAKRVSSVNFFVPRKLVLLGKATAIEYRCAKRNGGGDGRTAIYRHEFETPTLLCMDERSGKQLYIIGPEIKVTSAGIEK